jgi:hypothetical protein
MVTSFDNVEKYLFNTLQVKFLANVDNLKSRLAQAQWEEHHPSLKVLKTHAGRTDENSPFGLPDCCLSWQSVCAAVLS